MNLIHLCSDSPRPKPPFPAAPVPPPAALGYFAQDAADRCKKLTKRRRDVLVLMCKAMNNAEIGEALGISVHTVREYKLAIYERLGTSGAVESIVLATKAGLV